MDKATQLRWNTKTWQFTYIHRHYYSSSSHILLSKPLTSSTDVTPSLSSRSPNSSSLLSPSVKSICLLFFARNLSICVTSMIFGLRQFLLAVVVSLLAEKTHSHWTEVAWAGNKSMANLNNVGHWCWCSWQRVNNTQHMTHCHIPSNTTQCSQIGRASCRERVCT